MVTRHLACNNEESLAIVFQQKAVRLLSLFIFFQFSFSTTQLVQINGCPGRRGLALWLDDGLSKDELPPLSAVIEMAAEQSDIAIETKYELRHAI